MDSTSSMNEIFDFFIRVFTWIFEFLDSIQFWGISLLDFVITLFVIGAALPIIIAIVSTRPATGDGSYWMSKTEKPTADSHTYYDPDNPHQPKRGRYL